MTKKHRKDKRMTKEKIMKSIGGLFDKAEALREAVLFLKWDAEDAYDEIQLYKGYDRLTNVQLKRRKWLSDEIIDKLSKFMKELDAFDNDMANMYYKKPDDDFENFAD